MTQDLNQLCNSLVILGEDKDELEAWKIIFPLMKPDEQKKLLSNLQDELKQLQDLKNKQTENS